MTEQEFRRLIAASESEAAEFKPALLSRREIAEYAVGIEVPSRTRAVPRSSDSAEATMLS